MVAVKLEHKDVNKFLLVEHSCTSLSTRDICFDNFQISFTIKVDAINPEINTIYTNVALNSCHLVPKTTKKY